MFLETEEYLLDKFFLSWSVENMDLSEKTNQILLIIRFGKKLELFFELAVILNAGQFVWFGYFRFELFMSTSIGLSFGQMVQILILVQIFDIFWVFFDEDLKCFCCFLNLTQLTACLEKKLIVQDLVLDLMFVFNEFLIHSFVFLSISKSNNSIEVIMCELCRL